MCFISLLHAVVFVLISYTDRTSLLCDSEYLVVYERGEDRLVGQTRTLFGRLVGQTPFGTLSGLLFSPAKASDNTCMG